MISPRATFNHQLGASGGGGGMELACSQVMTMR
jgi:hypothetical protein